MKTPSPISASIDLVSLKVMTNGKDVSGAYEWLAIEVESALFRVTRAKVTIRDGSAADEDFAASASADFAPGAEIAIQAGYNGKNETLFGGVVWGQRLRVLAGQTTVLVLDCRDRAAQATVRRKYACFTDQTDAAVIQSCLGSYGLSLSVSDLSNSHPCLTQWDVSDWDFAMIRAQVNGCIALAADGVVTVAKPDPGAEPTLQVAFGDDLLDFDLRLDALTQITSAEVDAWDPANQRLNTKTSSSGNSNALGSDSSAKLAGVVGGDPVSWRTSAELDAGELAAYSAATVSRAELAKITGTVRFQGSHLVQPGGVLQLDGLGARFSGRGYVGGVRHDIKEGNWITQVQLGLDPAWFSTFPEVSGPPAAGLIPPVRGLQVGVVKAITGDPEGAYRVQVEVSLLGSVEKLLWARLANFYASDHIGDFFYPEVGDEVVLGFFSEDPRTPVILGFLYSKVRPPALQPDDTNSQKAIVTRMGLRVVFDEAKKSILLQTPNENQVLLSDDEKSIKILDQTNNMIEMSPSGIVIRSPKSISITATEAITIKSDTDISVKALESVSIDGAAVSVSADGELTASGTMSTSVTSEGDLTLQGLLVKIN